MFKFEFKEATAVLLVLAAIALGLAIIGTNPLDTTKTLQEWARYILAGFGGIFLLIATWISHSNKAKDLGPIDSDYINRLQETQNKIASITPENTMIASKAIGKVKFDIINGNILDSRSDVIVSSDDNHFSARGGVAKVILEKAGTDVTKELARYRLKPYKQGNIIVTTSGNWECRAIIHPAVIDLDENRYPTVDIIKQIVRNSLTCAMVIGAKSISFPVLGGGTASKNLKPSDSANAITGEILTYLEEHITDKDVFSYISLYIYDKNDALGLPKKLRGK